MGMETKPNKKHIRLVKPQSYRTYQLYATMASQSTSPADGLKIAALTCLQWLNERLEDNPYPELELPGPEEYKKVDSNQFISFTRNDGFTIDIEAALDKGIWALRINEPDCGSDDNPAVIGRVIRSDIAFRIVDGQLQCGFKITISDIDPQTVRNCYRFAVIRKLYQNKLFGIREAVEITPNLQKIASAKAIANTVELANDPNRQIPLIIVSRPQENLPAADKIAVILKAGPVPHELAKAHANQAAETKTADQARQLYDKAVEMSRRLCGYAHVVYAEPAAFAQLTSRLKVPANSDSYLFIEPAEFGQKVSSQLLGIGSADKLMTKAMNYSYQKEISYHEVLFLEAARQYLDEISMQYNDSLQQKLAENEADRKKTQEKIAKLQRQADYAGPKDKADDISDQLDKVYRELDKAYKENEKLKDSNNQLNKKLALAVQKDAYYKRMLKRPASRKDIVDWANCHFSDKLEFNKKAVDLLTSNSSEAVTADRICDALDYLATIYWRQHFDNLKDDDVSEMASYIYGRRYDVSPSGIDGQWCSSACKIRYSFDGAKPREVVLDWHLKVGGAGSGDLLRIYFIQDAQKKKLIIGSLPNHL